MATSHLTFADRNQACFASRPATSRPLHGLCERSNSADVVPAHSTSIPVKVSIPVLCPIQENSSSVVQSPAADSTQISLVSIRFVWSKTIHVSFFGEKILWRGGMLNVAKYSMAERL
ncbi:hypothetical protein [Phaffia rhodozyma]|uniref:Uncharacterized protein n=1 Tax=Phaffia rhodozyma TaxID=264483 RepID=A0A0F7SPY2_PHARH|nr:hypothetical protein [Phaffia rhodozyma]